jgi:NAD(P)-dependent dehydrogenase (short-subunit alcohol dehydrogenase family)
MTQGKTALVVGASRGLGLGLVGQLRAAGWQVIATVRDDRGAEALKAVPGVRVETLEITDGGSAEALAGRLQGTRLDLLLVNAGISGPRLESLLEADEAEVARLFLTNAVAPVRLAERLLPLVEPSRGVIAFMSSVMGSLELGPGMGMPLYGASKAALNHLSRSFAAGLGEAGPTVLSLHPGWVKTDMGGEEAPLDVEASCRGLVEVIGRAAGQGGHRYLDYQGQTLPW